MMHGAIRFPILGNLFLWRRHLMHEPDPIDRDEACELIPCPDESVDWETTRNSIIEGDALDALGLLRTSHRALIKMVFVDAASAGAGERADRLDSPLADTLRRKLALARDLLRDDGIMYVSIGTRELAGLLTICDEIFSEDNFFSSHLCRRETPRSEFIVGYARNKPKARVYGADKFILPFVDDDAATELRELFGEQLAVASRPVSLIKSLCARASRGDDIVVDCSADSGAAGHAVWSLNAEDGGGRRFILVEPPRKIPHPDYPTTSAITFERLRRAGYAIGRRPMPLATDTGFRVFRLTARKTAHHPQLSA
jgi:hypothetical protein